MPSSIRPDRRFSVHCSVTYHARPRTLCILPSESTQATTSRIRHKNWLGNCLANAAVSVSAMT